MDNADKLIQDQFNSLPPDIKEALGRVPWKNRVRDIAKREGLDEDQATSLETETLLILYGFEPPENYPDNIRRELGLDDEAVDRITKEVSDEIIDDIERQFEMIDAITPAVRNASQTPAQPSVPKPKVTIQISSTPEVAPQTLPETLPGETPHEVPHVEPQAQATPSTTKTPSTPEPTIITNSAQAQEFTKPRPKLDFPQSKYPKGQDPYREPLE